MDVERLSDIIWSQIDEVRTAEQYSISLPFLFDGEQIGLRLTWTVSGDCVTISDGGQVIRQLRNKLGDLASYRKGIQFILSNFGSVALEGGQNLVCRYVPHSDFYHTTHLNYLLTVISLLSGLRYLPLEGGSVDA